MSFRSDYGTHESNLIPILHMGFRIHQSKVNFITDEMKTSIWKNAKKIWPPETDIYLTVMRTEAGIIFQTLVYIKEGKKGRAGTWCTNGNELVFIEGERILAWTEIPGGASEYFYQENSKL